MGILVYIDIASMVKSLALGSNLPKLLICFLNANESLIYVYSDLMICCSMSSTHFPMGLVALMQSGETGLVGTGFPNTLFLCTA